LPSLRRSLSPMPSESSASTSSPSVAQLQAEITDAREQLVASLAELKAETTPGAIVRRGGRAVTGWFTDEFGGVRPERVAIAGAIVVGVIALKILRRRRR
jgi:hypothetical protein